MSDILDDLADAFNDEMQLDPKQEAAPVPRRRGRPLKSDATAPSNMKVSGAAPKPVVVPMPPRGVIATEMSSLYTFAAMPLMAIKPKAAEAMMAQADDIGKAWEQVAERNPKVRAALLGIGQTSIWAGLAMAHLPIIMAVMSEEPKKDAPSNAYAVGARSETGRHAATSPSDSVGSVFELFPVDGG